MGVLVTETEESSRMAKEVFVLDTLIANTIQTGKMVGVARSRRPRYDEERKPILVLLAVCLFLLSLCRMRCLLGLLCYYRLAVLVVSSVFAFESHGE